MVATSTLPQLSSYSTSGVNIQTGLQERGEGNSGANVTESCDPIILCFLELHDKVQIRFHAYQKFCVSSAHVTGVGVGFS
ncbi:hypothetical protein VNO77_17358 [Canavalia gladiata]|uniref:Uncharacterized protein n=1 Tax=Canavalia gladiata TaxID=3824 RepID=A0AAN9LIU2_CANGL